MPSSRSPAILCVGIAVQDIVFRVEEFRVRRQVHDARIRDGAGGCAVNAAIAVARLGGRAHYAGRSATQRQCQQSAHDRDGARGHRHPGVVRVAGATAPVSGIMVDAAGERMIVTHRDPRIESGAARRS